MFDNGFFFYLMLIVALAFGVRTYRHLKYVEYDAEVDEFEKALERFKFRSMLFAAILCLGAVWMLDWYYVPRIYLDEPQEKILEQLVKNQEIITERLRSHQNVLLTVGLFTGAYMYAVAEFVGKLQDIRKSKSPDHDTESDKPLGLE